MRGRFALPEEPAAAAETEVLRERRCLGRVVAEDAVEAVWAAIVMSGGGGSGVRSRVAGYS